MNDYKVPDPNCVFIGLGVGVSPEIPEQSEDLFVKGVMQHEKRDVIIEIMERVCYKMNKLVKGSQE